MKTKTIFLIFLTFVIFSCKKITTEKIITKDSTVINYIDSLTIRDSVVTIYKDSILLKKDLFPLLQDSLIEITQHLKNIRTFDYDFENNPIDSFKNNNFNPLNLFDNKPYLNKDDKGTRWARPGNWNGFPKYHGLGLYFSETYLITKIKINVFGYESLKTRFIVFNGLQAVLTDSTKLNEVYSVFDTFFTSEESLHFYIYNSDNNWLDIGELKIYGYKLKVNYIPNWAWVKSKIH